MDIISKLLSIPGLIFIFAFRGYSQAYVATKLGDPTPKDMGRLTMNPIAHIDPIGFIFMVILGFGYGKPVQIRTRYFKKVKRDIAIFYAIGPLSCIFGGFILTLFMMLSFRFLNGFMQTNYIAFIFDIAAYLGIALGLFHCLPIPGLDGYNFIANFVPYKYYRNLYSIEKYSMYISLAFILMLAYTPVGYYLISVPASYIYELFVSLWGLLPLI